jgi:hypothetical protein
LNYKDVAPMAIGNGGRAPSFQTGKMRNTRTDCGKNLFRVFGVFRGFCSAE